MPPELAQWIPPAVIVGLMLYLHRSTHRRMDRLESRLRDDMKRLDDRVGRLEHSQAKIEGLLEGLRAAITRQSGGGLARPVRPARAGGRGHGDAEFAQAL